MYPQGAVGDETLFDFIFGAGTDAGGGYSGYQGGEKAASAARVDMGVLLTATRPAAGVTDTVVFLLNNANATAGPINADAEGHFEQEWTVKCLAADLYIDTGLTADPAT
jgi:hypothetical protein